MSDKAFREFLIEKDIPFEDDEQDGEEMVIVSDEDLLPHVEELRLRFPTCMVGGQLN